MGRTHKCVGSREEALWAGGKGEGRENERIAEKVSKLSISSPGIQQLGGSGLERQTAPLDCRAH